MITLFTPFKLPSMQLKLSTSISHGRINIG